MAVIMNKFKPDEQNKPAQQVAQAPTMASSAPTSAVAGMGQQSQSGQQKPQQFTNIRQFLGANVKAGSELAGGLVKQKSDIEKGIQQSEQQVGDIASNVKQAQEGIKTGAQTATQDIATTGGQTLIQKPTDQQAAPQAKEEFKKLTQGSAATTKDYTTSAEAASQAYKQRVEDLDKLKTGLSTTSGRAELLQTMLNPKGTYQGGRSALDQMFLQRGGGQQIEQATKEIKERFPTLKGSLATKTEELTKGIGELGKTADVAKGEIESKLKEKTSQIDTTSKTTAAEETKKRTEDKAMLEGYLSGDPNFDPNKLEYSQRLKLEGLLNQVGLKMGQKTYGKNPLELIKLGETQINPGLTEDQAAQMNALATLSGQPATYKAGDKPGAFVQQSAADAMKSAEQQATAETTKAQIEFDKLNNQVNKDYNERVFSGNPNSAAAKKFNELNVVSRFIAQSQQDPETRDPFQTPIKKSDLPAEFQSLPDSMLTALAPSIAQEISRMMDDDVVARERILPGATAKRDAARAALDAVKSKYGGQLRSGITSLK
jgi:hypothetical protein